jgi:hypothetical protein
MGLPLTQAADWLSKRAADIPKVSVPTHSDQLFRLIPISDSD